MNPNLSKQFQIVQHKVPKSLVYFKASNSEMRRLAVLDPEHPVLERRGGLFDTRARLLETEYFAKNIKYGTGANKRALKQPREEPNPNVVDPHTVAFLDYHHPSDDSIYVDYVRSRQHGYHHAERLIRHLAEMHPEAQFNFGRVMNQHIWDIGERLRGEGRIVNMGRNF